MKTSLPGQSRTASDRTSPVSANAGDADAVTPPRLSILVVAYNSQDIIADCLGAIPPASRRSSYEVLLIDNGDGSTEALVAEQFPEVRVIASRGNVGFAAGNNLLAEQARGSYILLLNPDMVLQEGAIDALFEGVENHPEASAWGGVTIDRNGHPNSGNAIPKPSIGEYASAALGRSAQGALPPERLAHDEQVDLLMGGFAMLTRAAWQEAGGLDERYFLYCEEVDLFHRLEKEGHSFWRIAAARGYHEGFHGAANSPIRFLYHAAGTMEYMRAHWSAPKRALGFALFWLCNLERYLAGRLLGHRAEGLQSRAEAYGTIALRPGLWMHGYDKRVGLLAKLRTSKRPSP